MSIALLSIFLDITVLICLGITIYYALKLSKSLNNFRAYRKEFDALISELNQNIEIANNAVGQMKDSSNQSAGDLEDVLFESKQLAEELRLINQTSDSLASRLEKLAEKNRRIAQELEHHEAQDEEMIDDDALFENVEAFAGKGSNLESPFVIQDPDFQDSFDDDQEDERGGFQSQAEQELYQALKGRKKKA